jgi:hypothetical protein
VEDAQFHLLSTGILHLNNFQNINLFINEPFSQRNMDVTVESDSKVIHPEKPLSDEEQLVALGHVQELRREFSLWSIVCLQISLMGTWEALSSVVATALTNGGAPCLFYN